VGSKPETDEPEAGDETAVRIQQCTKKLTKLQVQEKERLLTNNLHSVSTFRV
jgi:hypothetical protein